MQTKRGEPNEQAEQEPEPAGSAESAAESEPAESEKRSAERLIFFPEPMGVPVGFTYFYLFAVSDSLLLHIPAALLNSFVWWLRTAPADLIIDNI